MAFRIRANSCSIVQSQASGNAPLDDNRAMLTTQRKKLLLARLASEGQLVAKELAQELGTSEDTIRRDLRELAAEGRLQRVHGGALPIAPAAGDLQARERLSTDDKRALGRHGAALVKPGQVVILDGGTTAIQVARHLPETLRATIVTHSPPVALEAAARPHLEIIVLGGRLFRHSMVNVGAAVIDAASRLRADLFFLGVTGVHPEAGLSTGDAEEAAVKRALHERTAETVVLASGEKLMAASPFVVAPLAEASLVVVPRETPARVARALRTAGVELARAP
jgi:DeoR/GlpR family transcriptional regulator of sugar metabolism